MTTSGGAHADIAVPPAELLAEVIAGLDMTKDGLATAAPSAARGGLGSPRADMRSRSGWGFDGADGRRG